MTHTNHYDMLKRLQHAIDSGIVKSDSELAHDIRHHIEFLKHNPLDINPSNHQYIIQKLQESAATIPEELIDSTIVDRSIISPVKHLSDNTWHTSPNGTNFQSIDGHPTIAWDPDNGHRTLTTTCKVKNATSKSKPSKVENFSSATSRHLMSKIGL